MHSRIEPRKAVKLLIEMNSTMYINNFYFSWLNKFSLMEYFPLLLRVLFSIIIHIPDYSQICLFSKYGAATVTAYFSYLNKNTQYKFICKYSNCRE